MNPTPTTTDKKCIINADIIGRIRSANTEKKLTEVLTEFSSNFHSEISLAKSETIDRCILESLGIRDAFDADEFRAKLQAMKNNL